MSKIVYEDINKYIQGLIPKSIEGFAQMEAYALTNKIPIIHLEGARLLNLLVKINNSRQILEVGTAIGYSTAWLAAGISGEGKVTTIEIDEARARIAQNNIDNLGFTSKVNIIIGDAIDILPTLKGTYDYIFIDAAKGQYNKYLKHCLALLEVGGVLVADNVLFRGMVGQEEVNKRYKTLVKGLQQFLFDLYQQPELDTVILPLGDGISISTKKRNL